MISSNLKDPTEFDTDYPSIKDSTWYTMTAEEWLAHVISFHFNPDSGSEYWLNKERDLGINAREAIKSIEDLKILGPMDEEDLRMFSVEHFIPKALLKNKRDLILGETSGTTGKPKVTAYLTNEFHVTFVDYFGYVATQRGFPTGTNWLWIGPSGPHIIGKAVSHVARRMGSMDPFSIDFDPRWSKKLRPGSFSALRYLEHVISQSMDLLESQNIEVLFTTPVVLRELATKMSKETRMNIKGVHYGGISINNAEYKEFKEELFPNAVHISGYGNTLFGLCLELEESPDCNLDYYPPGHRMILDVVSSKDGLRPTRERLSQLVDYGEKGQVVFHRLDESFFIPNMFERDEGVRIAPTDRCKALGFDLDGVRNPGLLRGVETTVKIGLY